MNGWTVEEDCVPKWPTIIPLDKEWFIGAFNPGGPLRCYLFHTCVYPRMSEAMANASSNFHCDFNEEGTGWQCRKCKKDVPKGIQMMTTLYLMKML